MTETADQFEERDDHAVRRNRMSNPLDPMPDELEDRLDELGDELADTGRADRTIEDQGETGTLDRPVDGDDDELDRAGTNS
jgi:hypothetical protein